MAIPPYMQKKIEACYAQETTDDMRSAEIPAAQAILRNTGTHTIHEERANQHVYSYKLDEENKLRIRIAGDGSILAVSKVIFDPSGQARSIPLQSDKVWIETSEHIGPLLGVSKENMIDILNKVKQAKQEADKHILTFFAKI